MVRMPLAVCSERGEGGSAGLPTAHGVSGWRRSQREGAVVLIGWLAGWLAGFHCLSFLLPP